MASNIILRARDLSKSYGGIQALKDVGFQLRPGEIHGLCGENGAGKSTFIKILGGFVVPSKGDVEVDGKLLRSGHRTDPSLISIVHQELSIIPHLSVLDNVMIGAREVGEIYLRKRYVEQVRAQLEAVGLSHIDINRKAETLSLAERQLVEIARGLARGAKVLLLDEPTATLSDGEISRVFDVVRQLKAAGTAVLLITHRLAEVFALTDRVTVFRNGQNVMTCETAEIDGAGLVRAMLGKALAAPKARVQSLIEAQKVSVGLRDWHLEGHFGPMNLDIRAGEILAVVGQLGSGAEILLESIAGLRPAAEGEMSLDGQALKLKSVRHALANGIAYVAEDRAGKGVFLEAPIAHNLTSQVLRKVAVAGVIKRGSDRDCAQALARRFGIDPGRLPDRVANLSGGNQQKVSLAKSAAIDPKVLVLNEPTRGVDVGARSEIYEQLRNMTRAGMTVVMYSTDLEEVLEVADRVVTIYRGKMVRIMSRAEASDREILSDILHSNSRTAPAGTGRSLAASGSGMTPDDRIEATSSMTGS